MHRFAGAVMGILSAIGPARGFGAQEEFACHPDIAVTLFAAEPLVVDPVALAFASNGDLYVVEMRDYPYGIPPENEPGGTVRLVRDTDGDGRADFAVLFARDLSFPTSVTPWRRGILVAAPPQILYLEDSDGDDVADVRTVVADGFIRGVTDGNLNGLQWGLDNRIHGTKGASGATVRSPLNAGPPLALGGYDFAFDPDSGRFWRTSESSAGFGLVFDAAGHCFSNYNIDYLQQHVIPFRYIDGQVGIPGFKSTVNISDHGQSARIFPVSVAVTRLNHPEQAGHFSAAAGMAVIESPLFPASARDAILVADVVGNLVHRSRLREDGPVFRGARVPDEQTSEFLAGRDPDFRPVSMAYGPDGGLYLADMRRAVIEHPDYIPPNVRATLDIRAGENQGRIYRVAPRELGLPLRADLSRLTPDELAVSLDSPNPWEAETAQRLLVEDRNHDAAEAIGAATLRATRHATRVRGLWTLEGLGVLDAGALVAALGDAAPNVRENALVLAERRPDLATAIVPLLGDGHARVRFQAALSISLLPTETSLAEPLWALLARAPSDAWTRRAVLLAARADAPELLRRLVVMGTDTGADAGIDEAIGEFAHAVAARGGDDVVALLGSLPDASLGAALFEGLGRGWDINPPVEPAKTRLQELVSGWAATASGDNVPALLDLVQTFGLPVVGELDRHVLAAFDTAGDPGQALEARLDAIRTVAKVALRDAREPLPRLLGATEPAPIQLAALQALEASKNRRLGPLIVENWRALSPLARPEAIRILLSTSKLRGALLDGLDSGAFVLGELNLDLEQRRTLLRWSSPLVRLRAAKFLTDEEYQGRRAVVGEWLHKLPPDGNATAGKAFFAVHCASCHRLDGVGKDVGPDLASFAHRSVEDLVTHIVDPNMSINPRYATCVVEKTGGETVTGILRAEDADALTLLLPLGVEVVIPRRAIRSFRALSTSLMPEGLEAALSPQAMRDLIAYLQETRVPEPTGGG